MQAAPLPFNEYERLMALARYSVLDTPPEESFDRLTALVAEVLKVPVALINFVDQFRQWGKSCVGINSSEAAREFSFCAWTILSDEVLVIENAHRDPRFADNPMVVGGEPYVHLYAGAPLIAPGGHAIGTLCVTDDQPHPFGAREIRLLKGFAAVVMEALELRVSQLELSRQIQASAAQMEDLRRSAAHAQTLAAITALFDRDVDPVAATQASAELLAQAVDVDWAGLVRRSGETLHLLSVWDRCQDSQPELLVNWETYRRSLIGVAAQHQQSRFIDDYSGQPGALPEVVASGVNAVARLPLGDYGDDSYVFVAARLQPRPWRGSDRALCEAAARSIRGALEREAHLQTVQAAADNDSLTRLANRRAFDQELSAVHASAQPYAVLMIDLDGLKLINDREGHARGDALLSAFAAALRTQFTPQATVYRFGGDEFAVLWCGLTPQHKSQVEVLALAQTAAQRLRSAGFVSAGASAGMAYSAEGGGAGAHETLRLADERMYQAKRRQRVGVGD